VLRKRFYQSSGEGGVEADPFKEGVDFDGGLCDGGEGTLGTLACGAETTDGVQVGGEVLPFLVLEILREVVDETVESSELK